MDSEIKYYILPLFPVLAVFTIIPCELYYTAQVYWDWKKHIPLSIAMVGAFLYIGLVLILYVMSKMKLERAARFVALTLFTIGMIILLCDVFAPLQTNLATGEQLSSPEPIKFTLIEAGLAFFIIMAALRLGVVRVAKIGMAATLLLLAIAITYLCLVSFSNKPRVANIERSANPSLSGNVYHFLLDEMQTDAAMICLEEADLWEEFSGFTLFKNNIANYFYTHASFPSYMTGTLFSKGSFEDWFKNVAKERGLLKALYEKGYVIHFFAYSDYWNSQYVTNFTSLNQLYEKTTKFVDREYQDFVQIVFARAMPNLLTNESLKVGKKLGSWIYLKAIMPNAQRLEQHAPISYDEGKEPYCSVSMMKELIETEEERPSHGQYVYAHVVLPHPPYVYDKDGNFDPKSHSEGLKGYYGQVQYAFKLIENFIRELKRLNRYENATIIIHADTGHGGEGFITKKGGQLVGSLEKDQIKTAKRFVDSANNTGWDLPQELTMSYVDHLLSRVYALLMIKPRQSQGRIRISERLTQLIDIYPTLCGILNLNSDENEVDGLNAFADSFPEEREMIVNWFMQRDYEPKIIRLKPTHPDQMRNSDLLFSGYANTFTEKTFPQEGVSFEIGSPLEGRLRLEGFGMKEEVRLKNQYYRWGTKKEAKLIFSGLRFEKPTDMIFSFTIKPFVANEHKPLRVITTLSSKEVILEPGLKTYTLALKFGAGTNPQIQLSYPNAVSPKSIGLGKDERTLTALWHRISLSFPKNENMEQMGKTTQYLGERLDIEKGIFYDIGSMDENGIALEGFGEKDMNENGSWRWATQKHGKMIFRGLSLQAKTTIEMDFRVSPFKVNENRKMFIVSELSSSEIILRPEVQNYKAMLDFPAGKDPVIHIEYPAVESPKNLGYSSDSRTLAALWSEVKLKKVN